MYSGFRICIQKGGRRVACKNRAVFEKAGQSQFWKSSQEHFFMYISNILSGGFCSKVKIVTGFFKHRQGIFSHSWDKGQIWAAITRPCRLSTPFCHTYSEPSGHEDSPGGTQNIPYLFKNLSKSRLSDPFFGLFLVISEVGSQIYIANLAIECFQQLFGMKSHCMP